MPRHLHHHSPQKAPARRMKVRSSRAALLSDYEVLEVMREMDRKLQEGAAAAAVAASSSSPSRERIASTDGYDQESNALDQQEERALKSLPSNLRSIQYKVLETLSSVQRPCAHQDATKIPAFMNAIAAWERGRKVAGIEERLSSVPIDKEKRLTKGEKLMLVNHAPTTIVELHTLVEEIEERFTWEEREDVLAIVAHTLPLDVLAMQREEEREAAASASAPGEDMQLVGDGGEEVYVGQEGEDDAMEDLDELENEGAGEGAVDDDAKDDE